MISSAEGWKYLPFAEACIVKLKKLNIPYANQSFMVGGFSIRVRVEPGHEYIEIDGGGCGFPMESGIVSSPFLNYGPTLTHLTNYLPGVFHETSISTAYNAAFSHLSADGKYKTNPSSGSSGQFSGVLARGKDFKGTLPVSTYSKAFEPRLIPKVVDGIPELDIGGNPVMVYDTEDMNLWRKKSTVASCPASVFTGRCRLYVQAMYGAPLYEDKPNETVRFYASAPGKTSQYQPVLSVQSLHTKKSEPRPADVELTTSSGVYLDPTTGKHWLFSYEGDYWSVYPLIADVCGESARKFLRGSDTTLSVEDKRHLETYILSTCRPDRLKVQTAAWGGTIPYGTTMGYGWHWNYSGTRADIANNRIVAADESDHTNNRVLIVESTHYSTVITKTVVHTENSEDFQQTWAATLSIVSGPSRWGVERSMFCIIAPNGEFLEKQTPYKLNTYSPTNNFEGSGTFYVFYRGDDLQTCRVNVVHVPYSIDIYDPDREDSSNRTAIGHPYGYAEDPHAAMHGAFDFILKSYSDSGWYKSGPEISDHYTVEFFVGPLSTSKMATLRRDFGGLYRQVGPGALINETFTSDYEYWTPLGSKIFPFEFGKTLAPLTLTMKFAFTPLECWGLAHKGVADALVPTYTAGYEDAHWGRAVVAIPQWDAEAVYLAEDVWRQETYLAAVDTTFVIASIQQKTAPITSQFGGEGAEFTKLIAYSTEVASRTAIPTGPGETTVDSKPITRRTLLCRAGMVDIPDGSDYGTRIQSSITAAFAIPADDFVGVNFNTICGTTGTSPVLAWSDSVQLANKALIPPTNTAQVDYAAIVGWT